MRKRIGVFLTVALYMGALCGCAQKQVDYVENDTQNDAAVNSLAEQFGSGFWEDVLDMPWGEETVSVEIDAGISVPKAEQMSVVKVKQYRLDEAGKEELLRSLFGEEVYYYDLEHKQKEDIEALLSPLEAELAAAQSEMEQFGEHYKEEADFAYRELEETIQSGQDRIAAYKEQMAAAPDTYEKAEDFSGEEYLGISDGTEYEIRFYYLEYSYVSEGPSYNIDIIPKNKTYFDDSYTYSHKEYAMGLKTTPEVEGLTEEEARSQAEKFLLNSGFSWYVETDVKVTGWWEMEASDTVKYGYVFTFEPGVDGLGFTDFGSIKNYKMDRASTFSDYAMLTVYVTPEDGIMVYAENPVEMISRTDGVALLGVDEVKEIMVNAIESGYYYDETYSYTPNKIRLNDFSLIYLRIWDGVSEDSYSYVPVWRLCYNQYSTQLLDVIFVNAMDGAVIDTSVNY